MVICNTYCPAVPTFGVKAEFMAVCTRDDNGQYAVYIGLVPAGTANDTQRREEASWLIAGSGSKQTYKNALHYFPVLAEDDYRL